MSWKKFEEQVDKGPIQAMGAIWKVGLCALILVGITTCGIAVVVKPFGIISDNLNSENVKLNYEWFKQRHEDVKSLDTKIILAEEDVVEFKQEAGPRKEWKRDDRGEAARLRSIATGLKQQRADLVADYNARSRMINRAIFKGTDTPERIK